LPATSVPAETVVAPEYELAPDRVSVLEPCFVSVPLPEMMLAMPTVPVRLKTSAALFVTSPPPSVPAAPPAPTTRLPAEMVVLPA